MKTLTLKTRAKIKLYTFKRWALDWLAFLVKYP